ncbi:MAG TPA: endonuclease domain-containing protein [Bacteroidia bacterium]|nr:endonuclease domain-containing protein [Bacteroidia bacterium]
MSEIRNRSITKIARSLRQSLTESEQILWKELRNRKLNDMKFLRQHPLFYFSLNKRTYLFIADFYCAEKKLVVELDGKMHDYTKEYDANRDAVMYNRELNVLRIKNEELENMNDVLLKIKDYL